MKFNVFDYVSFEEWQNISDQCSYTTFFHCPLWYQVFSRTYPTMKIATKKFVFADGKAAIFPLMQQSTMKGLIRNYFSSPAGCYGGWISADSLLPKQISDMTNWIFKHLQNIVWRVNPFDRNRVLFDRYKTKDDSTEILYLSHFQDEERLKNCYKHSVRKQINKAIRANLSVRVAKKWQEWEEYFEIYQMTLKKWGDKATSHYTIEFFRNLYNLQCPRIKLWFVTIEDNIIGGNLNFYQGNHCVEWHAAFDDTFFRFGSRNFLVHNIIIDALNSGYAFYDFNPSGGHEGTRRFKQSFGTINVSTNIITKRDIPYAAKVLQKAHWIVKTLVEKGSNCKCI